MTIIKICFFIIGLYFFIRHLVIFFKDKTYYSKEQYIIGFSSSIMITVGLEFFLILYITIRFRWEKKPNNCQEFPFRTFHVSVSTLHLLLNKTQLFYFPHEHQRLAMEVYVLLLLLHSCSESDFYWPRCVIRVNRMCNSIVE